jgi:hypothetical protein
MAQRRKPPRRPRVPPRPPVQLDPDTGLPPVGRGFTDDLARILRRARAKHLHKQLPPR